MARTGSSLWPDNPVVQDIPELVHAGAPRLQQHELLHFEKIMEAADATSASVFASRKQQRQDEQNSPCAIGPPPAAKRVSLGFGDSDDEEGEEGQGEAVAADTAIARALVKTIAATTGVVAPDKLTTTHDAIAWASRSILDARAAAIASTRRERYNHFLEPDQALQALKLIERLNGLLEGPVPRARLSGVQ